MENWENCGKLWKPLPFTSMIFDDIMMVYLLRMVSPYVKLPEAINGDRQESHDISLFLVGVDG